MTDIFIVASKGIPARYGGFETFADRLVSGKTTDKIKYHVSCMDNDEKHFDYNGADCFNVKVPLPGAAGRIFHVSRVLNIVTKWKQKHPERDAIVYILGCRIGPLLKGHYKKLKKLGVKVYVNPDGLEWKRAKWSGVLKKFLRYCEGCLVKNSDLAICDSVNIEKYINENYKGVKTTFIAYGADIKPSTTSMEELNTFLESKNVSKDGYYLIVGRFVPDNNYETMIREFMKSKTSKSLLIISNVEKNGFYEELKASTGFDKDERVIFAGTVYEEMLLKKIRENAYAYIHGHEVGGTNPSLLEALGATNLNLLLDVGFNKEVGQEAALYFSKEDGSLAELINKADGLEKSYMDEMGQKAKKRIEDAYSWSSIIETYEKLFLEK